MSYENYQQEAARLTILKELARQLDGRANEAVLDRVLDAFGYRRSREWIRTQIGKLEELGAVTVTELGTVLVAQITRAGRDHVEMRAVIVGVARPSPDA